MAHKEYKRSLVWLRRDLRLTDNTALARAAELSDSSAVVFIFDPKILTKLSQNDRRLSYIHASLEELDQKLRVQDSCLIVRYGDPIIEIPKLVKELKINAIFTNRDYEPMAKQRDDAVRAALQIPFLDFKDQVIFERNEILSGSGLPYKVFTPYKNAWLKALRQTDYSERKTKALNLLNQKILSQFIHPWDLEKIGFKKSKLWLEPGEKAAQVQLKKFLPHMQNYTQARDFPAQDATSGLSVALRFGTISIRTLVGAARKSKSSGHQTWLSELIWRDFYQMILDHFPHVVDHAFKPEYDKLKWPGTKAHFKAWCDGQTGYPIVDAAMRHFKQTGWMHNRLRMVVASFLTKDLLCDWRWGEAYFAQNLLDFDLAANNGGWQWSASTGCDAQPYFRIFNPCSQSERFDPEGEFIKKIMPELRALSAKEIHLPQANAIVDHSIQRNKALALFKKIKDG